MTAKPYMPSNGTEGMDFMAEYCDRCYKEKNCTILNRSLTGAQPKQWIYVDDEPHCTSFNPNSPKRKKKQTVGGLNLFNLAEAIEKAKQNMDKIKNVDKYIEEVKGI